MCVLNNKGLKERGDEFEMGSTCGKKKEGKKGFYCTKIKELKNIIKPSKLTPNVYYIK